MPPRSPKMKPLHLFGFSARLVAEVDSGFQKFSHADDCHGLSPFCWFC
jgi:hypothetical protein